MAELREAFWKPDPTGLVRADRSGGSYRQYVPDRLAGRPLALPSDIEALAGEAERAVRRLSGHPGNAGVEHLARFLLRSESIASSRIEGYVVSPQNVALAELALAEGFRGGFTDAARMVANNVTLTRRASSDLAEADVVSVDGIEELHRSLLPDERHHGIRHVQNWIGGPSSSTPVGADFVPPPPELVAELMTDLVTYLNGALHSPLIQAAMVHAQFETVHPFTDGNGRVGRALIHTVLARRGLTRGAVLPISPVLLTRSHSYIAGLSAYRYTGEADEEAAQDGTAVWIATFLAAVQVAVQQAQKLAARVDDLVAEWNERIVVARGRAGKRARPRADSATARLVALLPEFPVMTARTVQGVLDVSFPAARAALDELHEAGVLDRRRVDRGTDGYLAAEIFELLTLAERELATTQWDTRLAVPSRPAPARPPERR